MLVSAPPNLPLVLPGRDPTPTQTQPTSPASLSPSSTTRARSSRHPPSRTSTALGLSPPSPPKRPREAAHRASLGSTVGKRDGVVVPPGDRGGPYFLGTASDAAASLLDSSRSRTLPAGAPAATQGPPAPASPRKHEVVQPPGGVMLSGRVYGRAGPVAGWAARKRPGSGSGSGSGSESPGRGGGGGARAGAEERPQAFTDLKDLLARMMHDERLYHGDGVGKVSRLGAASGAGDVARNGGSVGDPAPRLATGREHGGGAPMSRHAAPMARAMTANVGGALPRLDGGAEGKDGESAGGSAWANRPRGPLRRMKGIPSLAAMLGAHADATATTTTTAGAGVVPAAVALVEPPTTRADAGPASWQQQRRPSASAVAASASAQGMQQQVAMRPSPSKLGSLFWTAFGASSGGGGGDGSMSSSPSKSGGSQEAKALETRNTRKVHAVSAEEAEVDDDCVAHVLSCQSQQHQQSMPSVMATKAVAGVTPPPSPSRHFLDVDRFLVSDESGRSSIASDGGDVVSSARAIIITTPGEAAHHQGDNNNNNRLRLLLLNNTPASTSSTATGTDSLVHRVDSSNDKDQHRSTRHRGLADPLATSISASAVAAAVDQARASDTSHPFAPRLLHSPPSLHPPLWSFDPFAPSSSTPLSDRGPSHLKVPSQSSATTIPPPPAGARSQTTTSAFSSSGQSTSSGSSSSSSSIRSNLLSPSSSAPPPKGQQADNKFSPPVFLDPERGPLATTGAAQAEYDEAPPKSRFPPSKDNAPPTTLLLHNLAGLDRDTPAAGPSTAKNTPPLPSRPSTEHLALPAPSDSHRTQVPGTFSRASIGALAQLPTPPTSHARGLWSEDLPRPPTLTISASAMPPNRPSLPTLPHDKRGRRRSMLAAGRVDDEVRANMDVRRVLGSLVTLLNGGKPKSPAAVTGGSEASAAKPGAGQRRSVTRPLGSPTSPRSPREDGDRVRDEILRRDLVIDTGSVALKDGGRALSTPVTLMPHRTGMESSHHGPGVRDMTQGPATTSPVSPEPALLNEAEDSQTRETTQAPSSQANKPPAPSTTTTSSPTNDPVQALRSALGFGSHSAPKFGPRTSINGGRPRRRTQLASSQSFEASAAENTDASSAAATPGPAKLFPRMQRGSWNPSTGAQRREQQVPAPAPAQRAASAALDRAKSRTVTGSARRPMLAPVFPAAAEFTGSTLPAPPASAASAGGTGEALTIIRSGSLDSLLPFSSLSSATGARLSPSSPVSPSSIPAPARASTSTPSTPARSLAPASTSRPHSPSSTVSSRTGIGSVTYFHQHSFEYAWAGGASPAGSLRGRGAGVEAVPALTLGPMPVLDAKAIEAAVVAASAAAAAAGDSSAVVAVDPASSPAVSAGALALGGLYASRTSTDLVAGAGAFEPAGVDQGGEAQPGRVAGAGGVGAGSRWWSGAARDEGAGRRMGRRAFSVLGFGKAPTMRDGAPIAALSRAPAKAATFDVGGGEQVAAVAAMGKKSDATSASVVGASSRLSTSAAPISSSVPASTQTDHASPTNETGEATTSGKTTPAADLFGPPRVRLSFSSLLNATEMFASAGFQGAKTGGRVSPVDDKTLPRVPAAEGVVSEEADAGRFVEALATAVAVHEVAAGPKIGVVVDSTKAAAAAESTKLPPAPRAEPTAPMVASLERPVSQQGAAQTLSDDTMATTLEVVEPATEAKALVPAVPSKPWTQKPLLQSRSLDSVLPERVGASIDLSAPSTATGKPSKPALKSLLKPSSSPSLTGSASPLAFSRRNPTPATSAGSAAAALEAGKKIAGLFGRASWERSPSPSVLGNQSPRMTPSPSRSGTVASELSDGSGPTGAVGRTKKRVHFTDPNRPMVELATFPAHVGGEADESDDADEGGEGEGSEDEKEGSDEDGDEVAVSGGGKLGAAVSSPVAFGFRTRSPEALGLRKFGRRQKGGGSAEQWVFSARAVAGKAYVGGTPPVSPPNALPSFPSTSQLSQNAKVDIEKSRVPFTATRPLRTPPAAAAAAEPLTYQETVSFAKRRSLGEESTASVEDSETDDLGSDVVLAGTDVVGGPLWSSTARASPLELAVSREGFAERAANSPFGGGMLLEEYLDPHVLRKPRGEEAAEAGTGPRLAGLDAVAQEVQRFPIVFFPPQADVQSEMGSVVEGWAADTRSLASVSSTASSIVEDAAALGLNGGGDGQGEEKAKEAAEPAAGTTAVKEVIGDDWVVDTAGLPPDVEMMIALYPFSARSEKEMSLSKGDVIAIHKRHQTWIYATKLRKLPRRSRRRRNRTAKGVSQTFSEESSQGSQSSSGSSGTTVGGEANGGGSLRRSGPFALFRRAEGSKSPRARTLLTKNGGGTGTENLHAYKGDAGWIPAAFVTKYSLR
ncbi:hypothetical protein HDU96_009723 [Phlyctochytrium bullatum]|nr:hypothetical protein HDU96_009723 [Phlyctochytrium bullatum]